MNHLSLILRGDVLNVFLFSCEAECVGLNGAGVDPVCPELARLSPLPTEAENRSGPAALSLCTAQCCSSALDAFVFAT